MTDDSLPNYNTVLPNQINTKITDVEVNNVDVQKQGMHQKFKNSRKYRQKFLLTMLLWYTGMSCGWISGQVGPSLLDLQIITDTSFEMVSKLLTVGSIGFLVGSILGGFLFSRVPSHLILSVSLFFSAGITAAIPWCLIFEVMMAVMFLRQLCLAVTDTVINAELLYIWRLENKSYMQALHFAFAFGGILSPLATAPFLTPPFQNSSHNNFPEEMTTTSETAFNSFINRSFILNDKNASGFNFYKTHQLDKTNETDMYNFDKQSTEKCCVTKHSGTSGYVGLLHQSAKQINTDTLMAVTNNNINTLTNNNSNTTLSTKSQFYIAFTITSSIALSCSLLYLILFLFMRSKKRNFENLTEETKIDTMSRTTKTLILMMMLALIGVYNAVEESFAGFVTTFCVKQLHWSKTQGSVAASVFWATFGGGRFSGIFLIRLCSPACMIDIYGVFAILSFVGLLFSSLENYDVAVWSCIVTIGISLSVFSPTIFTWTEEMIHVTGNIASGLKVAANTGSMVNSVILGILIDRYTPLWFCYLLLGECGFIFFLCIFATIYTRDVKTKLYTQKTIDTSPNNV